MGWHFTGTVTPPTTTCCPSPSDTGPCFVPRADCLLLMFQPCSRRLGSRRTNTKPCRLTEEMRGEYKEGCVLVRPAVSLHPGCWVINGFKPRARKDSSSIRMFLDCTTCCLCCKTINHNFALAGWRNESNTGWASSHKQRTLSDVPMLDDLNEELFAPPLKEHQERGTTSALRFPQWRRSSANRCKMLLFWRAAILIMC